MKSKVERLVENRAKGRHCSQAPNPKVEKNNLQLKKFKKIAGLVILMLPRTKEAFIIPETGFRSLRADAGF